MPANLTTVARVQEWTGGKGNEALIKRLIASVSAFVRTNLPNVALDYGEVTETYDGGGGTFMLLRQRPAVSVTSINMFGVPAITETAQSNPPRSGFSLEGPQPPGIPQRLDLHGYVFYRGRGNVSVTYKAGYVTAETVTIPDSAPYEWCVSEMWLMDLGVTMNGTAMTKVAAAPATGQYAVTEGVYEFSADDAGTDVAITYNYCPADICQAVTELIGERTRAKDRIGISGQGVGGRETVQYFSQKDMNAFIKTSLYGYTSTIPV